jgi:serine/threonine protein kinase
MADLGVGDRVDQYELTELLARSGMASVFKAKDTVTGELIALKLPHLHFESDVVFHERFTREQNIGQRLSFPGIVKVFPAGKRSRKYIAMELVEGTSLRAVLDAENGCRPSALWTTHGRSLRLSCTCTPMASYTAI